VRHTCVNNVLLNADILHLAAVSSLQLLLGVCERELERLDMTINVKNRHFLGQYLMFISVVLLFAVAENFGKIFVKILRSAHYCWT